MSIANAAAAAAAAAAARWRSRTQGLQGRDSQPHPSHRSLKHSTHYLVVLLLLLLLRLGRLRPHGGAAARGVGGGELAAGQASHARQGCSHPLQHLQAAAHEAQRWLERGATTLPRLQSPAGVRCDVNA